MKKSFSIPTYLLLAICFISCSLAKYPIDDSAIEKIDTHLLGQWRDNKSSNSYTLKRKDNTHYDIAVVESSNEKPEHYTAFISRIENVEFLNVSYINDSVNGYFFIRILELNNSADKARVTEIHDDSVLHTLTSPTAVRNWISANLNNPGFYSDTVSLRKSRR